MRGGRRRWRRRRWCTAAVHSAAPCPGTAGGWGEGGGGGGQQRGGWVGLWGWQGWQAGKRGQLHTRASGFHSAPPPHADSRPAAAGPRGRPATCVRALPAIVSSVAKSMARVTSSLEAMSRKRSRLSITPSLRGTAGRGREADGRRGRDGKCGGVVMAWEALRAERPAQPQRSAGWPRAGRHAGPSTRPLRSQASAPLSAAAAPPAGSRAAGAASPQPATGTGTAAATAQPQAQQQPAAARRSPSQPQPQPASASRLTPAPCASSPAPPPTGSPSAAGSQSRRPRARRRG